MWANNDTNADHGFTTGVIGDDEIFITDKAHVATFTTVGSSLDNQSFVRCDDKVTVVPNTLNNGLYPQFFGTGGGVNSDLCNAANTTQVLSQELSKNIAVTAFSCLGDKCTAPDLTSPSPADSITVTSPYYLAMGADFSGASAQTYSTNTLTIELIQQ